jgi:hypothetical protein
MHARLSHMNADANDELGLKMDHAAGQLTVSGGGKHASSFDLKVTHTTAGAPDKVNEQKGIKFQPGLTHTIQSSATAAAGTPFKVTHAKTAEPAPASAPAAATPPAKGQAHGAPPPAPKKH